MIGPQCWETGNLLLKSGPFSFLFYFLGLMAMEVLSWPLINPKLINSVLEENFAGGDGGGLALADESTILIKSGEVFRKNHAAGNGGGVLAAGLSATIGEMKSNAPHFAYFSFP